MNERMIFYAMMIFVTVGSACWFMSWIYSFLHTHMQAVQSTF